MLREGSKSDLRLPKPPGRDERIGPSLQLGLEAHHGLFALGDAHHAILGGQEGGV